MSTVKNLKQTRTLPFITDLYTPRGRYIETNWFDVPDQTYREGWSTGMEAAAQLLDAMRANRTRDFDVLPVLEAAAQALIESRGGLFEDKPCRRGAAAGFLRMIEASLRYAADSADLGDWVRAQREEYERMSAVSEGRRRVERVMRGREFAERMRTARAERRRLRDADDRVSPAADEIVLGGHHE